MQNGPKIDTFCTEKTTGIENGSRIGEVRGLGSRRFEARVRRRPSIVRGRRPAAGLVAGLAAVAIVAAGCNDTTAVKPGSAPVNAASSCAQQGRQAPAGCWREVLPLGSGGFPPAPGSQDSPVWSPGRFPLTLVPHAAYGGELWMVARTHAYSSPDGLTWTEHDKTDWGDRIYQSVVFFRDRLWMYGGMDYQTRAFLDDIWSSADGKVWTKVGNAEWPARGGQTMVAYRDQLWLFGGADHAAADRRTDRFLNDVWTSRDGVTWTKVADAAPWTARETPGVVEFDDALYLVGGQGHADVWRSDNGADWTQVTSDAPWKVRNGYGRAVFAGNLWVFGGWVDQPTNAFNDVWYSADGETWHRQAEHAPWGPRSPIVLTFADKVWVYSGKHTGGTDNWGGDLWQMTAQTATS